MTRFTRLHAVYSLIIITTIALQGSTFVTGTKVWPFMAYCMYADAHGPGPLEASRREVFAETKGGREFPMTVEETGLGFFPLNHHYLRPLQKGNVEAGRRLRRRLNRNRVDPVVRLRLESIVFTVVEGRVCERRETQFLDLID